MDRTPEPSESLTAEELEAELVEQAELVAERIEARVRFSLRLEDMEGAERLLARVRVALE
jgi:hypothetical protein